MLLHEVGFHHPHRHHQLLVPVRAFHVLLQQPQWHHLYLHPVDDHYPQGCATPHCGYNCPTAPSTFSLAIGSGRRVITRGRGPPPAPPGHRIRAPRRRPPTPTATETAPPVLIRGRPAQPAPPTPCIPARRHLPPTRTATETDPLARTRGRPAQPAPPTPCIPARRHLPPTRTATETEAPVLYEVDQHHPHRQNKLFVPYSACHVLIQQPKRVHLHVHAVGFDHSHRFVPNNLYLPRRIPKRPRRPNRTHRQQRKQQQRWRRRRIRTLTHLLPHNHQRNHPHRHLPNNLYLPRRIPKRPRSPIRSQRHRRRWRRRRLRALTHLLPHNNPKHHRTATSQTTYTCPDGYQKGLGPQSGASGTGDDGVEGDSGLSPTCSRTITRNTTRTATSQTTFSCPDGYQKGLGPQSGASGTGDGGVEGDSGLSPTCSRTVTRETTRRTTTETQWSCDTGYTLDETTDPPTCKRPSPNKTPARP